MGAAPIGAAASESGSDANRYAKAGLRAGPAFGCALLLGFFYLPALLLGLLFLLLFIDPVRFLILGVVRLGLVIGTRPFSEVDDVVGCDDWFGIDQRRCDYEGERGLEWRCLFLR